MSFSGTTHIPVLWDCPSSIPSLLKGQAWAVNGGSQTVGRGAGLEFVGSEGQGAKTVQRSKHADSTAICSDSATGD